MKILKQVRMIVFPAIVLPLIMVLIALVALNFSYSKSLYTNGANNVDYLTNSTHMVDDLTADTFAELQRIAKDDPESLENQDYIDKVNETLTSRYSYLIIRKDANIIYRGISQKHIKLEAMLPPYGSVIARTGNSMLVSKPENFLIKQQDFIFSDSSEGTLFIMSNLDNVTPKFQNVINQTICAIMIVLFMTSTILTWFMFKEFVRPIALLKEGTDRIREGDLDTDVEIVSDNEIGDLCVSFNEMRAELKNSINDRMRYEQDIRDLISNISHDLKTPLTAIKGYSEAIIDGVANTPEKMERYIKTIHSKADDMDVLLNELSIASKIDTNTIPYNFERIDIEEYFADCIEEISSDLEQKNMDFAFFNYIEERCRVVADPEQLKRVINNIVSNSCKYSGKTGKGGHLNIRLKDMESYVQVEIEDDGIGISARDLPNIFNRLYRADSSRSSSGGSGLGLSISKKIIEDHGGHIWASSKVGTGTTIYFTLSKAAEYVEEEDYE